MNSKRMIRRRELEKKTGLSATTIYHMERAGIFPQHFMLTPRCAVWDEAEVDAWLAERKNNPIAGMRGPSAVMRGKAREIVAARTASAG